MKTRTDPTSRMRGQAMMEYVVVTAALLGFGTLGWPYLLELLRALDRYYQSLYYVILAPLP